MSNARISPSSMVPLLTYEREGVPEITIFGALAVFSNDRLEVSIGGDPLIYGRSLTKPYQMKPIARDLRELSLKARALTVASHNAETFHLAALAEITAEIAQSTLGDDALSRLQLPESLPLMTLGRVGLTPNRLQHPCSGKHAAILRASRKHGWPLEDYLAKSHPYHQAYLQSLRLVLGSSWEPVRTAKDGCGLPAPTFLLSELAKLFEALCARKGDDWIWSAMTENPEMIGGTDRLDSEIMQLNAGQIAAKEGADGLLGLSFEHRGHAVGVVIKIAHGHDPKVMSALAGAVLRAYGFHPPKHVDPHGQTAQIQFKLHAS